VGLSVYFDELGQQKSTIARLTTSFHRKIGRPGTFGMGLYGGMIAHPWATTGSPRWRDR
jgi:hypothetical protein